MNFVVTIDWKFVVALGSAAERVSTHVADACKEYAFAVNSER